MQLAALTPSDVRKAEASRRPPPPPRNAEWRSDPDAREAVRSEEAALPYPRVEGARCWTSLLVQLQATCTEAAGSRSLPPSERRRMSPRPAREGGSPVKGTSRWHCVLEEERGARATRCTCSKRRAHQGGGLQEAATAPRVPGWEPDLRTLGRMVRL